VPVDGGGQYVGPGQTNVLHWAERYGIEVHPAHADGEWVFEAHGAHTRQTGPWPTLSSRARGNVVERPELGRDGRHGPAGLALERCESVGVGSPNGARMARRSGGRHPCTYLSRAVRGDHAGRPCSRSITTALSIHAQDRVGHSVALDEPDAAPSCRRSSAPASLPARRHSYRLASPATARSRPPIAEPKLLVPAMSGPAELASLISTAPTAKMAAQATPRPRRVSTALPHARTSALPARVGTRPMLTGPVA
jgi:hypothetical protein